MERKTYQITDQNIALIEAVKKEHPELKSDSAAMRFILTEYERERKRNTTEAEMRLIRIVQKEMEDKVNRLYDAVNTILIKNKEEVCFPASYMESPVYKKSREYHAGCIKTEKRLQGTKNEKIGIAAVKRKESVRNDT